MTRIQIFPSNFQLPIFKSTMSPINWNSSNNVGHKLVDEQHQEWVKMFNQLEEHMLAKHPNNPQEWRLNLLRRLLQFMSEHFKTEELLMEQYDYPDIVKHCRMHKDCENLIYEKYRAVMAGEIVLNSELMMIVRDWFIQHTSNEDKKTFKHIRPQMAKNINKHPAQTEN